MVLTRCAYHPAPLNDFATLPAATYIRSVLVLGIESSCDETAAAVVKDGREILSSVISSQIDLHKPFGGVVPELASREHLEKIEPIVKESLEQAGISFADLDRQLNRHVV